MGITGQHKLGRPLCPDHFVGLFPIRPHILLFVAGSGTGSNSVILLSSIAQKEGNTAMRCCP